MRYPKPRILDSDESFINAMTEKQHNRLIESAAVLKKFCEMNNIPKPRIAFTTESGACGYYSYHSNTLVVNPSLCAREVANPAMRCWSHPHYFTDRTIYGVLHHEFGHYLHEQLKFPRLPKERQITSYEPNSGERFAETIKLFLGNPDLLKQYDPLRYAKLIALGLKPVETRSWKQVMEDDGMSPRFIKRAMEKISA